eukprot:scaffold67260_cov68-Phaeocystis_antarctica.AAC.4
MAQLLGNHAREKEGGQQQPADERVVDEIEEVGHRDDAQLRPRQPPGQGPGSVLAGLVLLGERSSRRHVGERDEELQRVGVEQQPAEDEQPPVVVVGRETGRLHRVPLDKVTVRNDTAAQRRHLEGRAGVEGDEPARPVAAVQLLRAQHAQQHVSAVEDEERRRHAEAAQQHRADSRAVVRLLITLDAQARRGGHEQHAAEQREPHVVAHLGLERLVACLGKSEGVPLDPVALVLARVWVGLAYEPVLYLLGRGLDVGEGEALRVEEPRRAHHGDGEHPRGPRDRERVLLGLVTLVQHEVDEGLDPRVDVRLGVEREEAHEARRLDDEAASGGDVAGLAHANGAREVVALGLRGEEEEDPRAGADELDVLPHGGDEIALEP